MGNPAGVRRKKAEKRRAKFEQRLGPAAYLPKDVREAVNAELAKAETEAKTPAKK
jgi:hypothetical protein